MPRFNEKILRKIPSHLYRPERPQNRFKRKYVRIIKNLAKRDIRFAFISFA